MPEHKSADLPGRRKKVTVLLSLAPPDGTTRYVVQLTEGAPAEVRYLYFSWLTAILGRYDVFHVHWPEQLVRATNPAARVLKQILFVFFLQRLKITKTAIVRTLHNLHPHESGKGSEARLMQALYKATDIFIRLNSATPLNKSDDVTILHGHYIGRYPGATVALSQPGRLLYFGLIRPYKGVERLLEVFRSIPDPNLNLRVVGNPTKELRTIVLDACERDSRVSSLLKFVPDEILASEIYKAELVILPYKEMHNSGAILVALSLGRAVLAPRSQTNELLSQEVGVGWVNMYEGELTPEIVLAALREVRSSKRSNLPQLSGRDWSVVGEQHYATYLKAVRNQSGRQG